jgi:DNA-binding beta-propeller fold protein YncE
MKRSRFMKAFSSFIIFLAIICLMYPSVSNGENYVYNSQIPSSVLGLRSPVGVGTDSSGNVYVADLDDNRIVKFNSSGTVLLVIGGFGSGDGNFNSPSDVAVDSGGNIYVVDMGNNRIQKFNSSGTYLTQWGSLGSGNGLFDGPEGIAISSSGIVFVADTGNNRIQKFDSVGVWQAQWGSLGSGNGQFDVPNGIAVDNTPNVYVTDAGNSRVQKFNSTGGYLAQWGTFGTGNGNFSWPSDVGVDSSGNVYVVDTNNARIQKFSYIGAYLTQWGIFGSGNGEFSGPEGIGVSSAGNVYVADTNNNRIQRFDLTGAYQTQWGSDSSTNGQFLYPKDVAIDGSANVYVADTFNNRVQKFNSSGAYQIQWGTGGTGNGQFALPSGVATSAGVVYVVDTFNNRIQKFNTGGSYLGEFGAFGTANGQFDTPIGVAVDTTGNVYVADSGNNRIQKFNSSGTPLMQIGTFGIGDGEFSNPYGVAVDSSGNIYVADTFNDRVQKFNSAGVYQTQWGGFGAGDGELRLPEDIAVDSTGKVFVADTGNERIQKFDSNGIYQTKWGIGGSGNGQFNSPQGIAVNGSGKVYVADTNNNRVQIFAIGIITTSPIVAVPSGADIAFSTSITISGVVTATLYYKKGGEATYQSVALSAGTTWSALIPAAYNTMRGVAYYVDVVDNNATHYFDGSPTSPKNISVHGTINVNAKTTLAAPNVWNIIGSSTITDDKSITSNFGIGFGATWVAWRWNTELSQWEVPSALGTNPVTTDPFDAGNGWFYALDGIGTYIDKPVVGTSATVDTPFLIPLKLGWNLICQPFDFPVAWSDSTIRIRYGSWEDAPTQAELLGYVDNRAIWYNPDTKIYVTRYSYETPAYEMVKTRGQWLYSSVNGAYLVIPPVDYLSTPAAPSLKLRDDLPLWKVQLTLKSGKGIDIAEAIADSKGRLGLRDIKPPSMPISMSSINLVNGNEELSSDRQKQSNEMTWTFEVNTLEDSSLGWRLIGIPEDYSLILEDVNTGKQIDVRQMNSLSIGKGEVGHRYILKATRTSVPKATKLLTNYPNPFNPETWIPFELSNSSEVAVRIYTSTGSLVRTLNLGHKEAGYYVAKDKSAYWDGKNESGELVSSGIYFYSIKTGDYTATRKMVILK